MLKEEIMNARNELNKLIENGEREEIIYKASEKLDKLIMEYYTKNAGKLLTFYAISSIWNKTTGSFLVVLFFI